MSFNYSGFTETAQAMIGQFGRSVTLRQRTATVATADVPSDVTMTNVDVTVTAVCEMYRADQINGEQIQAQDRRYLFAAADLSTAPAPGWQIIDGSITYQVLDVERTAPGGTEVLYSAHARA